MDLQQLKAQIEPVRVYEGYLRLSKRGGRLISLCPFHKEKTPSFYVDEKNGLFYCFGCHLGGDVFKFVQLLENCDFLESVDLIADKFNLKVTHFTKGNSDRQERLYNIVKESAIFFANALRESPGTSRVSTYLKERGISKETTEMLLMGYTPNSWDGLSTYLIARGYSQGEIESAGVASLKDGRLFDRFRNRLMFTICDSLGRIIAFGGRSIEGDDPKYLNSPECPTFKKRQVLYGFHYEKDAIKEKNKAIIVEGYMDYLSLRQAGIRGVVATMGTALSEEQVNLLKRHCNRIVLNFDGDSAGYKAALRGIEVILKAGLEVSCITLPQGDDPDSFVRKQGKDAYEKLIEESIPFFKFLISILLKEVPEGSAIRKKQILDEVLPYIMAVEDPIEKSEYIKQITTLARLDATAIKTLQESLSSKEKGYYAKETGIRVRPCEKIVIKGLIEHPDWAEKTKSIISRDSLMACEYPEIIKSLLEGEESESIGENSLAVKAFIVHTEPSPDINHVLASASEIQMGYLREQLLSIQNQIVEASVKNDMDLIQVLNREKMAITRSYNNF